MRDAAMDQSPLISETKPAKENSKSTKGWPVAPQTLERFSRFFVLHLSLDIISLAIPILFILLAIYACRISGQSTIQSQGQTVEQLSKLGPTIFPIIFAAIASRALKSIARLRSERGETLGALWLLFNSKTITDTFLNQFKLRSVSITSILLLLLWTLSPLGGQASLRMIQKSQPTNSTTLRYMNMGPLGQAYAGDLLFPLTYNTTRGPSNAPLNFYESALMQNLATKEGNRDAWGNAKVPRLELLDLTRADAEGWITAPNTTGVEAYASLVGIPVTGAPQRGHVTFSVETSYNTLSISSRKLLGNISIYSAATLNFSCPACPNNGYHGDSFLPITNWTEWSNRALAFLGLREDKPEPQDHQQRSIELLVKKPGPVLQYSFSISRTSVEVMMDCEDGSCAVTKMRRSKVDQRNQNLTILDYWGRQALDGMSYAGTERTEGFDRGNPTLPTECFLNDSRRVPRYSMIVTDKKFPVNLTLIDPDLIAQRVSLLFNTYTQVILSQTGYDDTSQGFGPNHTATNESTAVKQAFQRAFQSKFLSETPDMATYDNPPPGTRIGLVRPKQGYWAPDGGNNLPGVGANNLFGSSDLVFIGTMTNATYTDSTFEYQPNFVWVTILLVSSVALLLISLAGIVSSLLVYGNDVFDPIMGLSYNNPYFTLPSNSSSMDSTTRARLLRNIKVRFRDMQGDENIGRLAFTNEVSGPGPKAGRLYD